jgi:hypothetical protein
MSKWDALRRARDNLKPHRSMSTLPSILHAVLDELRDLRKEIDRLKRINKIG